MIRFILNNTDISTPLPPGMVLLDFIRYQQQLTGTKIGCNEGDCGACTVLIGEWLNGGLRYRSATSCLTALGNAHGKHIVTIEGINMSSAETADGATLNPIQQAMCDESATQCGFCTPGFTVSLAGFCLNKGNTDKQSAIAAIDGNICRCTGYKSIGRAAARVADLLKERKEEEPIGFATQHKILPPWFAGIGQRLQQLLLSLNGHLNLNQAPAAGDIAHHNGDALHAAAQQNILPRPLGGGTDLYVQKHDEMHHASLRFQLYRPELKGITQQGDHCIMGASTTVTDIQESPVFQKYFPRLAAHIRLVSSAPIRNIATIAGNFINASPIGDFTIFFLALDAMLVLSDGTQMRELPLRRLYKGYKTLDLQPGETIEKIWFRLPGPDSRFHFEKVSKRTHLDIASVNSAIHLICDGNKEDTVIREARLSAGGVGPVPTFLEKTSSFLKDQHPDTATIREAIAIAQSEIAPISDARGSEAYKRLLLGQLIKAHFITLFPKLEASMPAVF
ncbi:MAG: FAD binding domain-containing protein [Bacteroidetes bacterium]|nr:FAD binding domain-containing protein [Bacteroidota bacterium]